MSSAGKTIDTVDLEPSDPIMKTEEISEKPSKSMRMSHSTNFRNTMSSSLQRPQTGAKSTRLSSARSQNTGTFSQQLELDHRVIQLEGKLKTRKSPNSDLAETFFPKIFETLEICKIFTFLDALLDVCVSDNILYGCGVFGLKELEFNDKGEVVNQYSLIDTNEVLDIHIDHMGRLIYTNPEDSSIYLIHDEDIVFVSEFIVLMAGLNIRLSKDGMKLYLKNKDNFLGCINLAEDSLKIDRVFNIKQVGELVKFEADVMGSEVVAMGSAGVLKVSEKNMTYKMATESKFKVFWEDSFVA